MNQDKTNFFHTIGLCSSVSPTESELIESLTEQLINELKKRKPLASTAFQKKDVANGKSEGKILTENLNANDTKNVPKTKVKMCCDCQAPNGLKICESEAESESDFIETCNKCFFDNLPPLRFLPYIQCQICGIRFLNNQFSEHLTICMNIPEAEEEPKPKELKPVVTPPILFLKKLKYDEDCIICVREDELCGGHCDC